jgi:glycosyltransferase involved in cell wall biosynthesis
MRVRTTGWSKSDQRLIRGASVIAADADEEVTRGRRAPLAERLVYLASLAEHAALAAALDAVPHRRKRPRPRRERLDVVFLSAYPPSHYGTASRFTRWELHLRPLGCDVEILSPSTDEEYAAFAAGGLDGVRRYYHACLHRQWANVRRAAAADVVVLHRGLLPFSPWQRPTFERRLARLNPALVYDFYDAIWLERHEAGRQPSRVGRWLNPGDKIEEIMRLARVVTVSNTTLAEWARGHHEDVRVIPMLLEAGDYEPRRHEARSPIVLGWFGNRYQIPRLQTLAPALRRLAASREILLRVVSSERVDIPGVPMESLTHAWSEESERADLASLDIGLLPLEDNPHDRGKSPLKILQYCASGLAVVATPVAIDLSLIRPGECFLPASDEDSWLTSMIRLVDDVDLRRRMGMAARAAVQRHYSFESHAADYLDALSAATKQSESRRRS